MARFAIISNERDLVGVPCPICGAPVHVGAGFVWIGLVNAGPLCFACMNKHARNLMVQIRFYLALETKATQWKRPATAG